MSSSKLKQLKREVKKLRIIEADIRQFLTMYYSQQDAQKGNNRQSTLKAS